MEGVSLVADPWHPPTYQGEPLNGTGMLIHPLVRGLSQSTHTLARVVCLPLQGCQPPLNLTYGTLIRLFT
jgi:hypothetical protein